MHLGACSSDEISFGRWRRSAAMAGSCAGTVNFTPQAWNAFPLTGPQHQRDHDPVVARPGQDVVVFKCPETPHQPGGMQPGVQLRGSDAQRKAIRFPHALICTVHV